ncbi:MAG: hypothetical protein FWG02_07395 [Holophagaceae bacterium]|nr:hypothetical protein [Holophagaceae bacterium]
MAIVSYNLSEPWVITPNQEARLKALEEMPDEEIIFTENCPKMTEEQLAGFRPWNEVMAELKALKKEKVLV